MKPDNSQKRCVTVFRNAPGNEGPSFLCGLVHSYNRLHGPLRVTIEGIAAEGYTPIECFCPRCRVVRLRPMSWLLKISIGLTLDPLAQRLRRAECSGPLLSVKPWRQA